ncbi:MAG TPA: 50S ribosomal protein L3 [Chloroflexota bacterium]|nr:50S ribosomal protein L3 [Chloroflexota bacterium]
MIKGIMGRKAGMTRVFEEGRGMIGVTVIQAGPCFVTQVKSEEKDGYAAVQIGFEESQKLSKAEVGHLKKAGLPGLSHLVEIRSAEGAEAKVGEKIDVGIFQAGDRVTVTGTSKGKGFAGVVKRHGFAGGPKTHGQSDRHRAPGSVGSSTTPSRVLKGTRMAGHMGSDQVTVKNLRVVRVDPERNLLTVEGAVPGAARGLLVVRASGGQEE